MTWLRKPKVNWPELNGIVGAAKSRVLNEAEHLKLTSTLEKLEKHLTPEPKSTEKQSAITPKESDTPEPASKSETPDSPAKAEAEQQKKKKRKGNGGRNGAETLDSVAQKIPVSHPTLRHSQTCPSCAAGRLYVKKIPAVTWKFVGQPMIKVLKYEREQLKCNLCDDLFTAPNPEGVSDQKYDESVPAVLALSRYGTGMPAHRLERLLLNFGLPFAASTQWQIVSEAADLLKPVFDEFLRQAANSPLVHIDDTGVKILDCDRTIPGRTGIHTTAMVAKSPKGDIALFLSGENHAGENFEKLLSRRLSDLPGVILMSDALSMNSSKIKASDIEVVMANCLTHARRNFVNICNNFPLPCQHVLSQIGKVYQVDSLTKKLGFSDQGRMLYHQIYSKPILERLQRWLKKAGEDAIFEPASGLGSAVGYLDRHWIKLTEFLRKPGIPLDNNICERAVKKMVLYRKNSLFYRNNSGSFVGDLFMSLIHTCELNKINTYDYLLELLRNTQAVAESPQSWLPWNFPAPRNLQANSVNAT